MLPILPNQIQAVSGETIVELKQGFEWLSTAANASLTPTDLDSTLAFAPAIVPGTVAMFAENKADLDASDHWYQTQFTKHKPDAKRVLLHLDGLLTFADVYLNGERILQSFNAYHVHIIDITEQIQANNQLRICFRTIKPFYCAKKPRAKYMTRFINERHLRFVRTPLLGYTPGFSASTKAVGPYRPIRLIYQKNVTVLSVNVCTKLVGDNTGELDLTVKIEALNSTLTKGDVVLLDTANQKEVQRARLQITADKTGVYTVNAQFSADNISAYWPHTHGEPKRYQVLLDLDGDQIVLGEYGFRRIERISPSNFALRINGVPLYLRGACWTPMDATSLLVPADALFKRLSLLRDFGINMLRVPGNMLYESDDFYAICDELGILIYQEFAFSNFDYPADDADFVASVQKEATDFLSKHGGRSCLTVLSGGSEVAQQASMMGLDLSEIDNRIFTQYLPEIVSALAPNVPYAISSPYASKGLPFHAGDGPCNYHGVGGYKRSFDDAKAFSGRFIAECLPFSHVPENESLRQFWDGEIWPPHHPIWKEGVPRDPSAGWDFSDTTDFYVEQLFQIDTVKLRSIDQARYLNYCRATLVETVETTLSIFRADSALGRAALVWNLHDLKPGAGWGYIDSLGLPKSAFYALGRTSQPTTILFVDEGLEGLAVYLAHDAASTFKGALTLALVTAEGKTFEQKTQQIELAPRSVTRVSVDAFIGYFVDSSYAYQFGPRAFIACVATLQDELSNRLVHKVYAHPSVTHQLSHHIELTASACALNDKQYLLTISSNLPVFFVTIDAPSFQASDAYFHVMPGFEKQVVLTFKSAAFSLHGRLAALNTLASYPIKFNKD